MVKVVVKMEVRWGGGWWWKMGCGMERNRGTEEEWRVKVRKWRKWKKTTKQYMRNQSKEKGSRESQANTQAYTSISNAFQWCITKMGTFTSNILIKQALLNTSPEHAWTSKSNQVVRQWQSLGQLGQLGESGHSSWSVIIQSASRPPQWWEDQCDCWPEGQLPPTGNGNLCRPLGGAVEHWLLNRFHVPRVTFLVHTEHCPVEAIK